MQEKLIDLIRREDYHGATALLARHNFTPTFDWKPGDLVFLATTKFWAGELVASCPGWVGIKNACWIADTGLFSGFHQACENDGRVRDERCEIESAGAPDSVHWINLDAVTECRKITSLPHKG